MKNINLKRAIIAAVIVWVLVMIFYIASFSMHILGNAALQANIMISLALIPCAKAGASFYYRKRARTNGLLLGAIMVFIAIVLDSLITVPVFIIPEGGSHLTFFSDQGFWVLAFEYFLIVVIYSITKKDPSPVVAK
jgi:hypothetical protein